jgi:5-methylcytosine-specific restriction endonuclease McrA
MTSKTKGYIVSSLRRIWRWMPERRQVKAETKQCPKCKKPLTPENVKVDHIDPVGSFVPEDNPYIMRMFCPKSNLQGMCRPCHAKKTKKENAARRKAKTEDK